MTEATESKFVVRDMDCEGCVASITTAVKRIDANASVVADLATKHLTVASITGAGALAAAIEDAGFTVTAN